MAESLSAEQIEERRINLRGFRYLLEMKDDDHLTTTLLMQEEWLATVDDSEAHIAGIIKQLQGYARDAHIIRGLRTRKCLLSDMLGEGDCTGFWKNSRMYCAPCYLRATHLTPERLQGIREGVKAVKEGRVRPWSEVEAEMFESEQKWMDGEEPNECEASGQAHIWIKMGKVGLGDKGLSVVGWGDAQCLRCRIPVPDTDFDVQEEVMLEEEKEEPNVCTNCQHDEHYWANHSMFNNPCGTEGCLCTHYLPFRVVGGH